MATQRKKRSKSSKQVKKRLTIRTLKSTILEENLLVSIELDGRTLQIDNSWPEFITMLIMLASKTYKNDTIKVLSDNGILCDSISIYTNVVIHPNCDESQYELYSINIPNEGLDGCNKRLYIEFKKDISGYILEDGDSGKARIETYKYNGKELSTSIKRLCKLLNTDDDTVKLNIISLKTNKITLNNEYKAVNRIEKTESLDTVSKYGINILRGMNINQIGIFGNTEEITSNEQMLIKFILWVKAAYQDEYDKLDKSLVSTDGIGICTAAEIDEKYSEYKSIKLDMLYFYYVDDIYQIIKFMSLVATSIGIPKTLIELRYTTLILE